MRKKTVAMLMAAMLIFGGAMGATVAWLTASTAEVVNIFTTSAVEAVSQATVAPIAPPNISMAAINMATVFFLISQNPFLCF